MYRSPLKLVKLKSSDQTFRLNVFLDYRHILIFKSILTFSKLGRKAHEHYLLKNVGGDRNRWNERDKEDGIE